MTVKRQKKSRGQENSARLKKLLRRGTWFLLNLLKWTVLIILPFVVLALTAWWSLISELHNDVLTVPDLSGRTVDEAEFLLSSQSLNMVLDSTAKTSSEVDLGLVLESDPPFGAVIKRRRNVRVFISAGFEQKFVPDLINKSSQEAEILGRQRNFTVKLVDATYSDTVSAGHIIAQSPEPSAAFISSNVDILLSRGGRPKLILLPNFRSKPLLTALEKLRSVGIPVIVNSRYNSGSEGSHRDISSNDPSILRHYYVTQQIPSPGSLIDISDPVIVTLKVGW